MPQIIERTNIIEKLWILPKQDYKTIEAAQRL